MQNKRIMGLSLFISMILHSVFFFRIHNKHVHKPNISQKANKKGDYLKLKTIPRAKVKSRPKPKIDFDSLQIGHHSITPRRPSKKLQRGNPLKQKVTTYSSKYERLIDKGMPLTNSFDYKTRREFARQKGQQQEKVLQYQSHPKLNQLLKKSSANFYFNQKEDQGRFNELDKVLFSFKKRMFTSYINSLLSSYNTLSLRNPLLEGDLLGQKHLLTGKIVFDKLGNIIKINILKSSRSDDVHELFEETLKGIHSLPNPPKMLIENRDQFTVYYQLTVN